MTGCIAGAGQKKEMEGLLLVVVGSGGVWYTLLSKIQMEFLGD